MLDHVLGNTSEGLQGAVKEEKHRLTLTCMYSLHVYSHLETVQISNSQRCPAVVSSLRFLSLPLSPGTKAAAGQWQEFMLPVLPLKPWELFGQVTSACSLYFSTGPGPSGFCLDWTLWPVTRVHVWNVLSWMITVYLCILSCKTKWNECSLWRQLQLETTNQQLARANQKDPSCSFPNKTDCYVRDSALLRKPRQHQDRANDKPFYGSSCFHRLQCNVTPWQRLFQHQTAASCLTKQTG